MGWLFWGALLALAWWGIASTKRARRQLAERKAALREAVLALDAAGGPSVVAPEPWIALQGTETCHWCGPCEWYEHRSRRGTQTLTRIDAGTLYLTDKRILFDGVTKNQAITWKSVLRISPAADGFTIERQTGKSPRVVITGDGTRGIAIAGWIHVHVER